MNSNEIKFTRDQTLAFMKDRHLAVTANAGSGKTSVLVEKYLDLLIDGKQKRAYEAIRSIVAITFTKQAASDMKAKITAKISKKMLDDPNNLKDWKNLREQISAAKVSTIHSFCNSLLRDYPIEAGISPVYREMDEYESKYYSEIAVDGLIEKYSAALLDSDYSEISPNLAESYEKLLDSMGVQKLRDLLLNILKEPVLIRSLSKFYVRSEQDLFDFYLKLNQEKVKNSFKFFVDIFSKHRDKAELSKNFLKATALIDDMESLLANPEFDFVLFIIKAKEFANLTIKGNAKIYNSLIDEEFTKGSSDAQKYRDEYKSLAKYDCAKYFGNDDSKEYLSLVKSFVELAKEADEIFFNIKNELSAYTFDDLLILTQKLLEEPSVRDIIIEDIKYLMVDEFQDTNQIQYDMVKLLVPSLENPNYKGGPKVFIVGDAKQSIYGFRSADVTVFNKAKNDIKECNRHFIKIKKTNEIPKVFGNYPELNDNEKYGDISLADTFRLLPAIAIFTNKICGNLFGGSNSFSQNITDSAITYQNLVCGRKLVTETNNSDEINYEKGTVRFLINVIPYQEDNSHNDDGEMKVTDEDENDISKISGEAEKVADMILKIVAGETDILLYRDNQYKAPEFKDIAILTRKKTSIQNLSPVFIEKKISFSVVSGKGFYQSQEVIDFISLLNFIVNQNDDIGFAGALKSPLFNITDGELMNIAQRKGNNFYEKFLGYIPDDDESKYFIDRSKEIIHHIIEQSALVSISELILLIIEITDYYGAVENFEAKEQMKSNINQLINSAREFESKGYKSLYEFIQRANSLSDSSSEAEAAFISGDNVVSIMTTHASKGLEFPVVILFDTNSRGNTDKGIVKSKNLGIKIPLKIAKHIDGSKKKYLKASDSFIDVLIKDSKNADDIAEEARLLYVAMTRAKDHLIISATLKQTKNDYRLEKSSFFGLIVKSLDTSVSFFATEEKFSIQSFLQFTGKERQSLTLPISIIHNPEKIADLKILSENTATNNNYIPLEYFSRNVSADDRFDIVSATKLTSYLKDNESFVNRYILGMPEIKAKNIDYDIAEDSDNDKPALYKAEGAEYGTVIHRALENIDLWLHDAVKNNYSKLIEVINKSLEESNLINRKDVFDRALLECKAISNRKIIIENIDNFATSEFEKELNMPFFGSIITGNIDLLLKNSDETLIEVWDWKSNKINAFDDDDFKSLCEHYRPQLNMYLYLISKLHPNAGIYTGRLLFTMLSDSDDWAFELKMTKNELAEFENQLKVKIKEMKQL